MVRTLSAAFVAALLTTTAVHANTVNYDLTAPFNGGQLTGELSLNVVNNLATSGSVSLNGPGIVAQTLYLTAPWAVYEATGGTEVFGSDNVFPISWTGMTFGTNAPSSNYGGYVFGLWDNGDQNYQGFAGGPNNLWAYTGQVILSNTTVPEPATWVMLGLGMAALGIAGHARKTARYAI